MRHPDLRDCYCCRREFLPRAFARQELHEFREALLISDKSYVPVACDDCFNNAVRTAPRSLNPSGALLRAV